MAYADDASASEMLKQAAHKAAITTDDHKAADIAHFTRLMVAGARWGVRNGSLQALEQLGVTVQPPAGYL